MSQAASFGSGISVPVSPANGGTGVANPPAHTLPVAEGAAPFNFLGPLTNGQLLIGSTGLDPVPAALTAGTNIAITNGAGSISVATVASPTFTNITSTGIFEAADGTPANPSYTFTSDNTSGMFLGGIFNLDFAFLGATVLSLGQTTSNLFGNLTVGGNLSANAILLNYDNATPFPYNVQYYDIFVSVDTSAGAHTVNLPNTTATGRVIYIKDRTGNALINNITVTTPGGTVTIDGATTYSISTNHGCSSFVFNGTNYEVATKF
jgi:hypothetical protein